MELIIELSLKKQDKAISNDILDPFWRLSIAVNLSSYLLIFIPMFLPMLPPMSEIKGKMIL